MAWQFDRNGKAVWVGEGQPDQRQRTNAPLDAVTTNLASLPPAADLSGVPGNVASAISERPQRYVGMGAAVDACELGVHDVLIVL